MTKESKTTSEVLESVAISPKKSDCKSSDLLTLEEIKSALHERGFAILMMLFSLPLSIPLPVPPGYTTIFSIPIIFFAAQITFGYNSPWLPKFLGKKSLKRRTLAYLVEKTVPLLRKLEGLTRPRIPIFNNKIGERVYGITSFVCAISIAIPLPMTNFIPAAGVVLMSLSVLNKDGLIGIIGLLVSVLGLVVSFFVIFLGHKVVKEVLSVFFG